MIRDSATSRLTRKVYFEVFGAFGCRAGLSQKLSSPPSNETGWIGWHIADGRFSRSLSADNRWFPPASNSSRGCMDDRLDLRLTSTSEMHR